MKKVLAMIAYKSGKYKAHAFVPDDVGINEVTRVRVLGGYETSCRVLEIIQTDVRPDGKSAQAVVKPEEDIIMMIGSKTVEVTHSNQRVEVCYTDLPLELYQTVVYQATNGTLHVGVISNLTPDVLSAQGWVVDTVDMTAHTERVEKFTRAKRIKTLLDVKRRQFQDIELLRLIAATDPETKELLDEYTALIGG